jgi:hypothetical protein
MQLYKRKKYRIMKGIIDFTAPVGADKVLPCDVMHEDMLTMVYSNGDYYKNHYHYIINRVIRRPYLYRCHAEVASAPPGSC